MCVDVVESWSVFAHSPSEVHSPFNVAVLEDVAILYNALQQLDTFGVRQSLEGGLKNVEEPSLQSLLSPRTLLEECDVLRADFQGVLDAVLDVILGEVNIISEVGKCDFCVGMMYARVSKSRYLFRYFGDILPTISRTQTCKLSSIAHKSLNIFLTWFNHPELRQVPRGVRVFCPEGRTEGVDVTQTAAVSLDIELSAHCEVGTLSEKVLGVVDGAYDSLFLYYLLGRLFIVRLSRCCLGRGLFLGLFPPLAGLDALLLGGISPSRPLTTTLTLTTTLFLLRLRLWLRLRLDDGDLLSGCMGVRPKHRSDTELFPSALAICAGDDGCVDVEETAVVEEFVSGEGHGVPDAHGRGVDLGARAKVGIATEVLESMLLLGHGVSLLVHHDSEDGRPLRTDFDCLPRTLALDNLSGDFPAAF